jgi:hypothetical protein
MAFAIIAGISTWHSLINKLMFRTMATPDAFDFEVGVC